ncbi:MAG: hypothetical protein K0Q72_1016 [Armatimonadetes bacterium]|jgi:hypothetical protein|nr:hypothetical protein [Armatimonadota bacterium]
MKMWTTPSVVQYGRVEQITLGSAGTLPDLDASLNVVNDDCPTGTFINGAGQVATRIACVNDESVS